MNSLYPQIQRLRSSVKLAFAAAATAFLAICSTAPVHTAKVKSTDQLTPSEVANSLPEEVYFNADARNVNGPSSVTAGEMSATSIGRVLSVLFNPARVELQKESDPMVATWAGTITLPTNPKAKPRPRSYLQDIRGAVNKSADSRVTIFYELGGKSFVTEFPYGTKHMGNIKRRFISKIASGSSSRYTASILIFAERRDPKSAVLVDIDALDIAAQ